MIDLSESDAAGGDNVQTVLGPVFSVPCLPLMLGALALNGGGGGQ